MTLSSDSKRISDSNRIYFYKSLQVFENIINILKEFEDNYEKKLNFSKLAKILNIPPANIDELASLFVKAQEVFGNVFKNHHLKKRKENNSIYLIAEKQIPSVIALTSAQINLFNDIIYTFRHVNLGKGFNLIRNGTKLSSKIKSLKNEHPYLFQTNGNGLTYPSSFGMKLGDLIISYNNGNKEIKELTIDEYEVLVRKTE